MLNLKNFFTLTVRVEDFNIAAKKPDLMRKLRDLTLRPTSGMNYELDNFERIIQERPVRCKVLSAYRNRKLVGWALLSKEDSNFIFPYSSQYRPESGTLFEVYVDPLHRRQGIASALLKTAKKECKGDRLCICPHDDTSRGFYRNFKNLNTKFL